MCEMDEQNSLQQYIYTIYNHITSFYLGLATSFILGHTKYGIGMIKEYSTIINTTNEIKRSKICTCNEGKQSIIQ